MDATALFPRDDDTEAEFPNRPAKKLTNGRNASRRPKRSARETTKPTPPAPWPRTVEHRGWQLTAKNAADLRAQIRSCDRRDREDRRLRMEAATPTPATKLESTFRHGHWRERRARIRTHLERTHAAPMELARWDGCGGACNVEWSPSAERYRLRASYCKNRHCEPCMRAKANRIAGNLRDRLSTRADGRYRFVTLTLKHTGAPLAHELKRLYKCFKALRKKPLWKNTQVGGAFVCEVKFNPLRAGDHRSVPGDRPGEWHPHLHVITEGAWLDVRELSAAWHEVTGDSFIVHVQALNDAAETAHYVAKYVTKSTNAGVWENDDAAQEWITASKGLRCCATFGNWRGFKLLKATNTIDDWRPVATLQSLIERASRGEAYAAAVILELRPPWEHEPGR